VLNEATGFVVKNVTIEKFNYKFFLILMDFIKIVFKFFHLCHGKKFKFIIKIENEALKIK
jgi:hypothetical protein